MWIEWKKFYIWIWYQSGQVWWRRLALLLFKSGISVWVRKPSGLQRLSLSFVWPEGTSASFHLTANQRLWTTINCPQLSENHFIKAETVWVNASEQSTRSTWRSRSTRSSRVLLIRSRNMIKRGGRGSASKCPQQAHVFLNMLNFNHLNDEAEWCKDSRDTLARFRPVV